MAYAFVNSAVNVTNSASITYSPTAGNTVIIYLMTSSGGGSPYVTAVTDGQGGTWSGVLAALGAGATQYVNSVFFVQAVYCPNIPAGVTSISLTFNGGNPGTLNFKLAEYSGLATSSSLVAKAGVAQTNPGAGANAITTGNVTVPSGPVAFINFVGNSNSGTYSAGTGFTSRGATAINGSVKVFVEDLRLISSGTQAGTATSTVGAADTFVSIAMAFTEAVVGLVPVQSITNGGIITASSFTVTLTGVTAGNFLTLQMSANTPASGGSLVTFLTPLDTNGTWLQATTFSGNNTGVVNGAVLSGAAFCANAAAGTHVVTVRAGGFTIGAGHASLVEWPGSFFGSATSVDTTATAQATTANAVTSGTTLVTSNANELALVQMAYIAGAGVANAAISNPPTGFTTLYVQDITNANDLGVQHSWKQTSTPATQSASWTWTDATTLLSHGSIAVFSPSVTVGPPTPFSQTIFFAQDRTVHY